MQKDKHRSLAKNRTHKHPKGAYSIIFFVASKLCNYNGNSRQTEKKQIIQHTH